MCLTNRQPAIAPVHAHFDALQFDLSGGIANRPDLAAALIADAVPKILAELYILTHYHPQSCSDALLIPQLDVAPILTHFDRLSSELQQFHGEQNLREGVFGVAFDSLSEALTHLRSREVSSGGWCFQDLRNFSNIVRPILNGLNTGACSRATHPVAPSLEVHEFDTEFSGVLDALVSEIVSVEQHLVIDPSLPYTQNGFARAEDVDEIRLALSLCESRLLGVCLHDTIQGFLLTENNQEHLRKDRCEIVSKLQKAGFITDQQRVGFMRLVGLRFAPRKESAKQGVDLYHHLMQVADFSWRGDAISLGICLVRGGEMANTSIHDHMRVGWRDTGITILASDGVTPYKVLIRDVEDAIYNLTLPRFGFESHFAKYAQGPSVRGLTPRDAKTIWNSDAERFSKEFFSARYPDCNVQAVPIEHGLSLLISHVGRQYNLIQMRPRTDAWTTVSCRSDSEGLSLEQMLPRALKYLLYGE